MSDYYNRTLGKTVGGETTFKTPRDSDRENQVIAALGKRWNCEIHKYKGHFNPIDWYAIRNNNLAAFLELKSPQVKIGKYPTAILNLRKWFALVLGNQGFGVPCFFVARWECGTIKYINVYEIPIKEISMGGCKRVVKSSNDIEPIIRVPINLMRDL